MTTKTKPTQQLYDALQQAYDAFNHTLFKGELDNSLITLQRKANSAGYMSYNRFISVNNNQSFTHELALNPDYFGVTPLVETFQTIVHEMCHLWQEQYGNPSQKTYHNREWAEKMKSIGLMPSHTGRVGGKEVGQDMADYPIEGGLFLAVSKELHQRGCIVEWYDRFKPKNVTTTSMLNTQNFAETIMFETSGGLLTIPHLVGQPSREDISLSSLSITEADSSLFGVRDEGNAQVHGLSQEIVITPKPSKVKTESKIKFTCPCGENIWGKASLDVMCKKCNGDFIRYD